MTFQERIDKLKGINDDIIHKKAKEQHATKNKAYECRKCMGMHCKLI